MKYYSISQNDKFQTLVGKDDDLSLYNSATEYALDRDKQSIFSRAYEVEFNSDDRKKKLGSDFFTSFKPALKPNQLFRILHPILFRGAYKVTNFRSFRSNNRNCLKWSVRQKSFGI